jgi:spore maturation protein CgeB
VRTKLNLVFIGLSLSSSWGNGHATTYRALLKALAARGHDILFLEQDRDFYAAHRDLADPQFCRLELYKVVADLARFRTEIANADAVIVGSYVADGIEAGRFVQAHARGVTGFYDIDTPVTLASLARGACDYLEPALMPGYDLYFSFTGGPTLELLERKWHSPLAQALYCSVDPELYHPVPAVRIYDLGYLGTYSDDRQPMLDALLIEPARRAPHLRFIVAGPQYPASIDWPENVTRIDHVGPDDHPAFYASCRYTLNVTRADMVAAGYSPSVRLFEAAACGTPIISDFWEGLESFFQPGEEIVIARSADGVLARLLATYESERKAMSLAARAQVLDNHTSMHRAVEFETALRSVQRGARCRSKKPATV